MSRILPNVGNVFFNKNQITKIKVHIYIFTYEYKNLTNAMSATVQERREFLLPPWHRNVL